MVYIKKCWKIKNPFTHYKFHRKVERDWTSKIMEWLLYFGCFFPFIKFVIYIGSDTQPTGLLIAVAILAVCCINRKAGFSQRFGYLGSIMLLVGAIAAAGLLWVSIYDTARAYFSYISLLVIPLATYLVLQMRGGLNERLMKGIIWIWFVTGFVQKYINSTFLYEILSRHSTNEARGVVSLSSEPSAYGYMCLFMLLFAIKFEKNAVLYVVNLLIQIVLFAQSSVTLVYLGVYIGMYMVNELVYCKKYAFLKAVVLAGGGIGTLVLIAKFARKGSRMQVLVETLFKKPQILLQDESIEMRLNDIQYSVGAFLENHAMPHGMAQKMMSGAGTVLYECGFIGVIILVLVCIVIWNGYPRGERITYTFAFLIVMFSSITFSSPIISFYLGWCMYQRKLHVQQHETAVGEIAAVNRKGIIRRKEYESSVDM